MSSYLGPVADNPETTSLMRATILVLAGLILTACSSDISRAKQAVEESLVITEDLEFEDVRRHPGDVVCGRYSASAPYQQPRYKNQPFIMLAGVLDMIPSETDWQFYCNDDHATALLEQIGLGPFTADNAELMQITRDLSLLADALEAYYQDNHYYPSADQGLRALLEKPESQRPLPNYREGGYLRTLPQDPWGRPYQYSEEQWGRVKGKYTLTTLGKSAQQGGMGREADVSSRHLPYLQHVARLLVAD